ncbi:7086_t:CDS:2 [Paraglomus occultum]|uniref:7086_t:CDS:1 n=1 Tax=Paraglomus occultum TaxID=144539 RepID=A0A9N9CRJ8_9GLOM|nr:7086_t:CDS:2 [Paraglomus occultum]
MTVFETIVLTIIIATIIYFVYGFQFSGDILVSIIFLKCPDEEPTAARLNASMTLKEIRKKLSAYEDGICIMMDDMFFCGHKDARIRKSDEGKTCLYEILNYENKKNIIYIKRCETLKEVMPHLIGEKNLNCGIRWTEEGPKQSDNVAFKFKGSPDFKKLARERKRKNERSNNYKRSELYENGIDWEFSLNIERKEVLEDCRAMLFMRSEHIEPSDNFQNEVDDALRLIDPAEKSDRLKGIFEKYGHFWARTRRRDININTGINMEVGMGIGTGSLKTVNGISQNNERLNQNSSSNALEDNIAIGGDKTAYMSNDTSKWQATLQDCSTWVIIGYEDIVPIYEISKKKHKLLFVKIPTNVWEGISEHQIFAEVMYEGEHDTIFAANIVLMPDGRPHVYVSRIKAKRILNINIKQGEKSPKLRLAYIITGHPQSSDSQIVDKLPVAVEVNTVEGEKRDDKFVASLPGIPNTQDYNQGAILTTCITQLMCQPESRDCILFTMHLHKSDDSRLNTTEYEVCISGKHIISLFYIC